MQRAICNVSVAPLRAENSDRSEMVSQMLYGETCDILTRERNWVNIRMHFDGYEGWVDYKQISELQTVPENTELITETYREVETDGGKLILPMGAEINGDSVQIKSDRSLTDTALSFLNAPYLWGGRSFFGIDCSGLVQMVYKVHGLKLPRDAWQQAELGEDLAFAGEALPGDLAFFDNAEGRIIHVGIMLDDQRILHAHGKVRIDQLDSSGIYNAELKKHTHRLRFIKRILT
ncbi:MAG: hydrolase Nlp/P60 [Chryseobacterium sp.]|nr:MAG: hydrolase Nlp/P60 [Chryseobacterium sp.]